MKYLLFFLIVTTCFNEVKAQRSFAEYMQIGVSFSYIRNDEIDDYKFNHGYDEFTLNTNVGIQISKGLFTGIQILNIFSSQIATPKNHYSVYGLYLQYNFITFHDFRFYAEGSFNRGNYCVCGDIPYHVHNLYYLGFGAGFDYPIRKIPNLYVDGLFVFQPILNKIENKTWFNRYSVGLNYKIRGR